MFIKSLRDVLLESKPILTYRKKKVFMTRHSLDRIGQRTVELETIKDISKKAIEYIKNHRSEFTEPKDFLFYSKSNEQGFVAEYRKDNKNTTDKEMHIVITTVLPKKKEMAKSGTQKVILEAYDDISKSIQSYKYIRLLAETFWNESRNLDESYLSEDGYDGIKIPNTNLTISILDNKFYDINIDIYEGD